MPKVSVIIPCYNHGQYLNEAVESVLNQTWQNFEIIIVDDGSDDEKTRLILADYNKPKTRIIHTDNQGLASARNNGIKEAKGEYVLPLDADDKIGSEYTEIAVKILDENPDIGIVYCQASYFGDKDGLIDLPEFSLEGILKKNIIFCSGFFRKRDWERVKGYNTNMVYGLEDWDFWLSLLELNLKPYRIPKTLFYYRIKKTSMLNTMSEEAPFFMIKNVIFNHRQLFKDCAEIYIVPKVAQLYIDAEFGFNNQKVIKKVIFGSGKQIEFDLNETGKIKGLRFDPINDFCVIHIEKISIQFDDRSWHKIENIETNAAYRQDQNFIFLSNDPRVYFEVPNRKIKKVTIKLNFIATGKAALTYIINYQNELISQKKQIGECDDHPKKNSSIDQQEMQSYGMDGCIGSWEKRYQEVVSSTAWKITFPLRWIFGKLKKAMRFIGNERKKAILDEISFFYFCYLKKDRIPPQRFNYVGGVEFVKIGKLYFDNIINFCGVKESDKILDIGSGIGRVATHFLDYLNNESRYEGFEIVERGVKWCNQKLAKQSPVFRFQHANIYNKEYNKNGTIEATEFVFPYIAGFFDFAFAASVFTHILPDAASHYLNEIYRVLKPGGRVFISCFLLNQDSKTYMSSSEFSFKLIDKRYGVMIIENPEAAIAYEESFFRELFKAANLSIKGAIHYGTWCNRKGEIHGQDIIIAEKRN